MAAARRVARIGGHINASPSASAAAAPWWELPPGTKTSYTHSLGADVDQWAPGRGLPTVVVRGEQPGPTLLVTAGVHGNEYDGMAAIQEVFAELEPEGLSEPAHPPPHPPRTPPHTAAGARMVGTWQQIGSSRKLDLNQWH